MSASTNKRPHAPFDSTIESSPSNRPRYSNDSSSPNLIDDTIQLLTHLKQVQADLNEREAQLASRSRDLDERERRMNEQYDEWQIEKQQLEARLPTLNRETSSHSSNSSQSASDTEIDDDTMDHPNQSNSHLPSINLEQNSRFSTGIDAHDRALLAQYDAVFGSDPAISANRVPLFMSHKHIVPAGSVEQSTSSRSAQPLSRSYSEQIPTLRKPASTFDSPENTILNKEYQEMLARIAKQRIYLECKADADPERVRTL